MNIYKVKQLFFEATNAKVVVGGDTEYSINILRRAYHLSAELEDDIWPYITAYRLAHLLFRKAGSTDEFDEIIELLKHAEKSASSYISIHSGLLKFAALNRLKMLGLQNAEELQKSCLEHIILKISEINKVQRGVDDLNRPIQSEYFNVIEYLVYATGFEYDRLNGIGYDDLNTLFPGRNNDVWRIFGPKGAIDEFAYNYETGQLELERCVKAMPGSAYFIYGRGRESRLYNSKDERDLNTNRINLLSKILMSGRHGEEISTLSEIWTGTTDPQENTKKNRQELSAFLGGNILFQPSKTRWALKEDSKILGLIKVDFLH